LPETTSPRVRKTFSKLEKVLDVPNLIDIQKASFRWFMGDPSDPNSLKTSGLRETIDDISPIRDYSERLEVALGEYTIGDPVVPERECREKDLSYEVPVNVKVAFTNLDTGEIREQTVFLGNFPWMTDQGTFIINGTERVVVTQLVRSPGAYIMEPKDRDKQVFTANLMPSRGSWLELEIDKKGLVNVRIDRKRKLPITTLLRALPAVDENTCFIIDKTDEGLLALFG
jgi:DNA-directed RNA polymerase subunit beta